MTERSPAARKSTPPGVHPAAAPVPALSVPADAVGTARSGAEPIRVLIADDHALFRRGLEMVLKDEAGIELVGQAPDGAEAVLLPAQGHSA